MYYSSSALSSSALGSASFLSVLAGVFAIYGVIALAIYVLLVIAMWRIFTKAGEAGWKSLIPIYNVYIWYKIVGLQNAFWLMIAFSVIIGLLYNINATLYLICTVIYSITALLVTIFHSIRLSKSFGHQGGFAVGLIFLPTIFTLILGFSSDKFVGLEETKANE